MSSLIRRQLSAISYQKVELLLLALVLLTAIFLRFYKLGDYMTFLGDEGRDAIMVKRILTEGHLPLLGPPMSVGNMYLGPLYYYMMAISMAIFWLNPVAAAGMNALIGVLTVGLIYYLARAWFGRNPALVAAFGYAISPITIIYSRSSWNPNPVPFFALLSIIGLHKARQTKNYLWLILTGGALAFALQMHYLSLILILFFLIIWIYEFILSRSNSPKNFFTGTILAIFTFIFLMSPLFLFDLRHNFMNYHAITTFFFQKDSQSQLGIIEFVSRVYTIYTRKLIGRYLMGENILLSLLVSAAILIPIIKFFIDVLNKKRFNFFFFLLTVWLLTGLLSLSLLNQQIYDHYLNFLNPIPYLLIAALLGLLKFKVQMFVIPILIVLLLLTNTPKNPLFFPTNNQLYRTQEISKFVISKSGDKPFNFALIAQRNYDSAYQFYLDIYGHKPEVVPLNITDQLFVVCEDAICNPINNPKYEIAGFGYAKVAEENQIMGVNVFKLVANPGGKPE